MRKIIKQSLAAIMVVLIVFTSAPLSGFVGTSFKAEAADYKVGDIIQFGSYPQSEIRNEILIAKLNDLAPAWNDWTSYEYYSGSYEEGTMVQGDWMRYTDIKYNNNTYRGVKFEEYRPGSTCYDSGVYCQSINGFMYDVAYWFKFEPINWRILDTTTGLIMCQTIIDAQPYSNTIFSNNDASYNDSLYTNYASDYKTSSIRKWLNKNFYNTAFSDDEKEKISTSILNNDGYYTCIGITGYEKLDSDKTYDKVFLLSYNEVINDNYDFNPSKANEDLNRMACGSDYAKSQGLSIPELFVSYGNPSPYNGNSSWHLRSPAFYDGGNCYVGEDGIVNSGHYVINTDGVRPALRLKDIATGTIHDNDKYTMKIKGSSGATNSISKGEEVTFYVYLLKNGEYVPCENNYAFSFDNPGVFEAVSVGSNNDCFAVKLKAQNIGSTNMTISDDKTGASITIYLRANMPLSAITFDEVKDQGTFYENSNYHYWNYFYDYNGLYVNDFNYSKKDDNYYIDVNIFNEKAHFGAVVSYDKKGTVVDYKLINPMDKLPTNLWDNLFDYFDLTNAWLGKGLPGEYLFVNGTFAKETPIKDLKVPEGGYFVITNNSSGNEFVFLANLLDITIDCSLAISKIPYNETNDASKNVIEEIIKNFFPDTLGELSIDIITKLIKDLSFDNIGDTLVELSKEFEKAGIDFWKILKESVNAEFGFNLAEGIAFKMLGLDFITDIFGYTNTILKMYDINCSVKAPQIAIYSPVKSSTSRTSNGITVSASSSMNSSYVLHTYLLNDSSGKKSQAKPTIETISKNYEMYDIGLYKNGEVTQPETEIEIFIPIPAGMNKNRIQVYWYKDDGTLEAMNAEVRGSYAVFKTTHLSYYIICDVPCTKHEYIEEVAQPTCTEGGSITYTCACGDTYTEDIPKLGHNFSKDFTIDKKATYTEAGVKSKHCLRSGCNAKSEVTAIPKLISVFKDNDAAKVSGKNIVTVAGVTVKQLLAQAGKDAVIKDSKGNVIAADNSPVTGMTLTMADGKQYTIVVFGDADGDGKVSAADARLALRASVGLENYKEDSAQYKAANVGSEDKLSAADARLILRASVGLEDPTSWLK